MKSREAFWATSAGILALTLTLSACTGEEKREYEIPESLCGTEIQAKALEPLMPPGKEISMESSSTVIGLKRCHVSVDGEEVLTASIDWQDEERSATDVASFFPGVDSGDERTEDGRYLYSAIGAIGEVACPKPRKPERKLFVTARVGQGEEAPGEAAMKEFIAAYAEEVAKSDECT